MVRGLPHPLPPRVEVGLPLLPLCGVLRILFTVLSVLRPRRLVTAESLLTPRFFGQQLRRNQIFENRSPPQGRRLFVPPLVHLEGQGRGSVGGGGVVLGVSDPLFFPSSSLSGSDSLHQLFPILHQREGSSRRGLLSHRQGGGRTSSSLPWVLESPVHSLEDVEFVASSDGPLPPGTGLCFRLSSRSGPDPGFLERGAYPLEKIASGKSVKPQGGSGVAPPEEFKNPCLSDAFSWELRK